MTYTLPYPGYVEFGSMGNMINRAFHRGGDITFRINKSGTYPANTDIGFIIFHRNGEVRIE
jgi:hypothetical protein